ncbi:hypothetical protein Achl_4068 (plasmid) [Pseudarthrobacter chlorophenolicus A6]|uniref:Uncharacterized protein n=2 Tax=Pseudarthrobacter chlorophenolicus TaxID=85085 RepID=B8HHX2_PSECP|nr:hypothetical protein Achl_4068 [Pseudarthrobacter chlorophenolicus A6]SDQ20399.1 hypothetical protein SAMN04489738_0719 [Pseudarthrobacter chlorophenolicus]
MRVPAAHIEGMTKNREDLHMESIVNDAIANYLEDRKLTGAAPFEKQSPAELDRLRRVFLPVIWSALPSILTQLNAKKVAAEETQEEILADFKVPDSLEGLIL